MAAGTAFAGPTQTPAVQRWHRRFLQQFAALSYKTWKVAIRNRRSSIIRIIVSPFLFILLVYAIDKAISADNRRVADVTSLSTPDTLAVTAIPACEQDLWAKPPCWDFFYSPNTSATVRDVVAAIQQNNPGRPIPDSKVVGFASRDDANAFMFANPERVLGALHFNEQGSSLGFTMQTNSTIKFFKGTFQNPQLFVQMPLQVAAEREISRYYFQQANRTLDTSDWTVSTTDYAHPAIDTASVIGQVLGPFIFAALMFSFVLVIQAVVSERELGLRQALRTMGMLDSAYWLSWTAFELIVSFIISLLLIAFGAMFQLPLMLHNSFGILWVLFTMFQLAMVSFALLLSTLMSKAATAVNLGFIIFIIGWVMQTVILFGYPYTPDYVHSIKPLTVIFTLFPWSPLVKSVDDLGKATAADNVGLKWHQRFSYCQNLSKAQRQAQLLDPNVYKDLQCVFPIGTALQVLLAEWIVYFVLAVYLDNVLPNESGVRRQPWYFLLPSYWANTGRLNWRKRTGAVHTAGGLQFLKPEARRRRTREAEPDVLDQDVAAEEQRVRDLLQHRRAEPGALAEAVAAPHAVEMYGLQKVYRLNDGLISSVCGRVAKDFWAIKGTWLTMEKDQLFCLLGPNGAGKTTTIKCLTGVLPATGGDALVYGQALSSPGGLDRIRAQMGVCPQFDILWNELTGREHMLIYGNVKGIPWREVRRQADELLASVRLTGAANMRSSSYSGGMKRRLSVAIALLGDPKILMLDEPTTGMDPISRRHVWDIIEQAKAGRAIVLTTHSMEEADILGDRIAIMARGRLRCIGSSLHLKQRFGSGYQLSLSVLPNSKSVADLSTLSAAARSDAPLLAQRAAGVKAFMQEHLGLAPADETRAYIQYLVPRKLEGALPGVLGALEAQRGALGVTDVQLSLTSLEEVFLTIARKAELEAAAAEGRATTAIFLDDISVEVPLGEEFVDHPLTGMRYQVKWAQDDSGNLQILSWAPLSAAQHAQQPMLSQQQQGGGLASGSVRPLDIVAAKAS